MGVRSYILGIGEDYGLDNKPLEHVEEEACLGKMVAYVDFYKDIPKMETVQWLEKHLTDEEDKEYLEQYKDVGYVGESITFNQIFTHEEILEFVEAFYNDKVSKSEWKNVCGLSDVVLLLEDYVYFMIEWTGA